MCSLAKVALEEVACKVLQLRNSRIIQSPHVICQCNKMVLSRNYSESKVQVQEKETKEPSSDQNKNALEQMKPSFLDKQKKIDLEPVFPGKEAYPNLIYWNEAGRIKSAKKEYKRQNKPQGFTDFMKRLYGVKSFPKSFTELVFFLKDKYLQSEMVKQRYLFQRVAVLKPDLAAAHFILYRRGSIKFVDKEWMTPKEAVKLLPCEYIPNYFVEGINAEGTDLIKEGFANLTNLRHLKWLSLKGLESVNDWVIDWVAMEYHETLEHLDISNCVNVTHRALSCFYRFEKLKTLKVEGVSDSAEFKVACLMLYDIFPYLEIIGINLEIPQKIEPLQEEEIKNIEESSKGLQRQNSASL